MRDIQKTLDRCNQLIEKAGTRHKDYKEGLSLAIEVIEYLCDRLENSWYWDLETNNLVLCDAGSIPDGITRRDEMIKDLEEQLQTMGEKLNDSQTNVAVALM